MNNKELLDSLESTVVEAVIPVAREIKTKINHSESEEQIAKNIIGKIGLRLVYGSDVVDKFILEDIQGEKE